MGSGIEGMGSGKWDQGRRMREVGSGSGIRAVGSEGMGSG